MIGRRLRCYLVRYRVAGGASGAACVVDGSEDEARETIRDHFAYHGQEATITQIKTISLVEGAYVLSSDAAEQEQTA